MMQGERAPAAFGIRRRSCCCSIKKTRAGYENYGVFSGLALAPSPPPVPAALALLGLVSLPGAP
jgi:hypothetical protein